MRLNANMVYKLLLLSGLSSKPIGISDANRKRMQVPSGNKHDKKKPKWGKENLPGLLQHLSDAGKKYVDLIDCRG